MATQPDPLTKLRIFLLYQGEYGSRIVENLALHGFAPFIQGSYKFPNDLPNLIDDPSPYLPISIPKADLIIALNIQPDLLLLLPKIARLCEAKAAIIPVDRPEWLPPGLETQLKKLLSGINVESVFPRPFCLLDRIGNPWIDQVADMLGRPRFKFTCEEGIIKQVEVLRGAPCGSTWHVAEKLVNKSFVEARTIAALALHTYPCLGSRQKDPVLKDSIIHTSAYAILDAVDEAISEAQARQGSH